VALCLPIGQTDHHLSEKPLLPPIAWQSMRNMSDSATCLYRSVHIPTSKLQEIIGRSGVYGALDRGNGFETANVKSLFGWTPKNSKTQMPRESSFSGYLKRK
jgi:hypothetical protein